jgi:hypothetical protein
MIQITINEKSEIYFNGLLHYYLVVNFGFVVRFAAGVIVNTGPRNYTCQQHYEILALVVNVADVNNKMSG